MKKLTNKQMSHVHGGDSWFCTYMDVNYEVSEENPDIGPSLLVEADSAIEAADKVHKMTGSDQVNCTAA